MVKFSREIYRAASKRLGFTLAELLIVVAILGILAAIGLPLYQGHSQQAKEVAAKENLRILRMAIERYAAEHNGIPPGYPSNNTNSTPTTFAWAINFLNNKDYFSSPPKNPFNGLANVQILADGEEFPDEATGSYGWICKPIVKQIKLDWLGIDSQGNKYYEY